MIDAASNLQLSILNPFALWALIGLPLIYFVSRLIAPPPRNVEFSAVFILKKLKPTNPKSQKPPLWQVLLRILAILFLIFSIADLRLNPKSAQSAQIDNIEIFIEDTFAQNQNWRERSKVLIDYIETKTGSKISVYFINNPNMDLINASAYEALNAIKNAYFSASEVNFDRFIKSETSASKAKLFYFSDGIKYQGHKQFHDYLSNRAKDKIVLMPKPDAQIIIDAKSTNNASQIQVFNPNTKPLVINGFDNDGRIIASTQIDMQSGSLAFKSGQKPAYFSIQGQNHSGAIFITENYGRKPSIGVVGEKNQSSGLIDDAHFLKAASQINNPITSGEIETLLKKSIDIIVMGDVAGFSTNETKAMTNFLQKGGTIIRFLGPKSMGKPDDELLTGVLKSPEHNLIGQINPTNINIEPFRPDTIFANLPIPQDAKVEKSVLLEKAHPQTEILAKLSDGAPLISSRPIGDGKLYVIHTSASPLWSNLGLGPLQFEILGRIFDSANLTTFHAKSPDQNGALLLHMIENDAKIRTIEPPKTIGALPIKTDENNPAGVYWNGATQAINIATNRKFEKAEFSNQFEDFKPEANGIILRGPFLLIAVFLLMLESLIRIFKNQKILRHSMNIAFVLFSAILIYAPNTFAQAKKDNLKLSYLVTGDVKTDNKARSALIGLAQILERRTNIEPSGVIGLKADAKELMKQPIIYWLLAPNSQSLSPSEAENLNKYMKSGGIVFIDTQGKGQTQSQSQANLRRALSGLIVPPLEKLPQDHVLRKSFYILQGFPGFYQNSEIWVESANSANSNSFDGVSPIIIGDGDWASIWALSAKTSISPFDYQKDVPLRVGVNIYIYALTGQYKADQLHIDAILKRINKGAKQ